jgi:hypothetical protein
MKEMNQQGPTTFQEGHRYYTLELFQDRGSAPRLTSFAATVAGCLRTMARVADGIDYLIVAWYKNEEIGRGRYRKRGPTGLLEVVKVLEVEGAMIGLLETGLAKWEAEQPHNE